MAFDMQANRCAGIPTTFHEFNDDGSPLLRCARASSSSHYSKMRGNDPVLGIRRTRLSVGPWVRRKENGQEEDCN